MRISAISRDRFAPRSRPLAILRGLFQLSRQRRDLRHLSDEQLSDLGITRAEALREAERPIWDAPHFWKS